MTIEESYETIGDDLDCDWMENLEGKSLDELRAIRRALGHDVEASEQEFLSMLRARLPHLEERHGRTDSNT